MSQTSLFWELNQRRVVINIIIFVIIKTVIVTIIVFSRLMLQTAVTYSHKATA
jgi:hypothetical protein